PGLARLARGRPARLRGADGVHARRPPAAPRRARRAGRRRRRADLDRARRLAVRARSGARAHAARRHARPRARRHLAVLLRRAGAGARAAREPAAGGTAAARTARRRIGPGARRRARAGAGPRPDRRVAPGFPPLTAPDPLAPFDYELPPERIAQRPAEPRESARLLVLDRAGAPRQHERVSDLPALLRARDLLVVNATRVLPARPPGAKGSGRGA